jgi:hypothetical protein
MLNCKAIILNGLEDTNGNPEEIPVATEMQDSLSS